MQERRTSHVLMKTQRWVASTKDGFKRWQCQIKQLMKHRTQKMFSTGWKQILLRWNEGWPPAIASVPDVTQGTAGLFHCSHCLMWHIQFVLLLVWRKELMQGMIGKTHWLQHFTHSSKKLCLVMHGLWEIASATWGCGIPPMSYCLSKMGKFAGRWNQSKFRKDFVTLS